MKALEDVAERTVRIIANLALLNIMMKRECGNTLQYRCSLCVWYDV